MKIVILVLLCIVALVAAVVLWPFAVTGFLVLVVSGIKSNRWWSSGLSLALVVVWRITTGEWPVRIGDSTSESWHFEVLPGMVSWALATILVSGFAQWPAKFLEGYLQPDPRYQDTETGEKTLPR